MWQMKSIIKRWAIRTSMTVLVILSVVAIIKTSWMHEWLKDAASCVCLLGSWLCARAVWPHKEDMQITQPMIAMPSVPVPVTQPPVNIWPDGDVVERILQEEWRN